METKITRKEFYDLVWSTPMTKLAARYGISDVALRKKCLKHDIPTPGLGYWAKLAAGQRIPRPKLRASNGPDLIPLEPLIRDPSGDPAPQVPDVEVPMKLGTPHPVVAFLKQRMEGSSTDEHGRLTGGDAWTHCLRPKCLPRLLRILQGLFEALEERGHKVDVGSRVKGGQPDDMLVIINGEVLYLRVEERLRKKERPVTKSEREEFQRRLQWKARWGERPPRETKRWTYYPDGDLVIRTGSHWQYKGKATWSDSKHRRLEEQLGQVILGLEAVAAFYQRVHEEAELARTARIEQERTRLRPERMKKYEQLLTENLHEMAENWTKAKQLRAFLDECQARLPDEPLAQDWLQACREYAEHYDPFHDLTKVPKTLSPSDEALERLVAAPRSQVR